MGNCIRKDPYTQWGGEDWGSFGSAARGSFIEENSRDFSESKIGLLSSSSGLPAGTEVKIRISKKQLEHILKKSDVQGASAGQVLAQLMNDDDDMLEAHHRRRPWRPELQSIPE